jgi:hypothetical protein
MTAETLAKMPPFARWLRAELREQRVEAASLAAALSVPRLAVHSWLMGDAVPARTTCARIAQFLEVPDAAVLRLAGWSREK